MAFIDGATRVFGIIGDPIKQIRTPQAMNRIIAERRSNAVFVPFHVRESNFVAFVTGLKAWQNLPGFTLTVPHKVAAMRICDRLGPMASLTGSVNVVRKGSDGLWEGETFDGVGFVNGMLRQGIDPKGARIFVQGAGGAAKAIVAALAHAKAAKIAIANRTPEKAKQLAARINASYSDVCGLANSSDLKSADIVVNATSLGLNEGDGLPIEIDMISSGTIVAEVIMNPEVTPLLRGAASKGCKTHAGIHMLEAQIIEIANYLTL